MVEKDQINPKHYDLTPTPLEVIEAWGLGFHLGNVIKYIPRAGVKDPDTEIVDLKKAAKYLDRHIKNLEAAKLPDGIVNGKYQVNYIAHAGSQVITQNTKP